MGQQQRALFSLRGRAGLPTVVSLRARRRRVLDGFASIGRVEAELSKAQDPPSLGATAGRRPLVCQEHHPDEVPLFTFGFAVKAEGTEGTQGTKRRVAEWERNNRRMYRRYAREAWLEWLVLDPPSPGATEGRQHLAYCFLYPPERCDFSDLFGSETLTINHGVRQEHITTIGAFSRSEQREFQANPTELKLTHDSKVFGFDVLKRERTGSGFGIPTVAPLFVCAAQLQSLEVGDAQLAAACRTVMEQQVFRGRADRGGPEQDGAGGGAAEPAEFPRGDRGGPGGGMGAQANRRGEVQEADHADLRRGARATQEGGWANAGDEGWGRQRGMRNAECRTRTGPPLPRPLSARGGEGRLRLWRGENDRAL